MKAADWLQKFSGALERGDINAAAALFEPEGFWRDLVSFTWNIKTCEGRAEIKAMLAARLADVKPRNFVPKGEWYDYHAKYIADDTQYLCPGLDGEDEARIRELAMRAFVAAGCKGWGRVDVMRDRNSGQLYLIEVNTAPGMTSHSLVPKAARQVGIEYDELCWRVLEATVQGGAAA